MITDAEEEEQGSGEFLNGCFVDATENGNFQVGKERHFVRTIAVTQMVLNKELWNSCCALSWCVSLVTSTQLPDCWVHVAKSNACLIQQASFFFLECVDLTARELQVDLLNCVVLH